MVSYTTTGESVRDKRSAARTLNVSKHWTDDIEIRPGGRAVNLVKVAALAESMAAIGLQQPITLWIHDERTYLVAGRHRLEAARKLGWAEIPCVFADMDEIDCELWQIDENLMRFDLGDAEAAKLTARRAALCDERAARDAKVEADKLGKDCPVSTRKGGRGKQEFASATAAATGKSKRAINMARRRGERIAPDVMEQIPGTVLDKGTELDALAAMPPDEQREAVAKVQRGEATSVREPKPKPAHTDKERLDFLEETGRIAVNSGGEWLVPKHEQTKSEVDHQLTIYINAFDAFGEDEEDGEESLPFFDTVREAIDWAMEND